MLQILSQLSPHSLQAAPFARSLHRLSVIAFFIGIAAIVLPICQADELFVIDEGTLQRLTLDSASVTEIGVINVDVNIVSITFTPDGDLWALADSGAIYRVDTETAALTPIRPSRERSSNSNSKLMVLPDFTTYVIDASEITRTDSQDRETSILWLHPAPGESTSLILEALTIVDGHVAALGTQFDPDYTAGLFAIGEETGVAVAMQTWDWPQDRGFRGFDQDSDGDLWIRWTQGGVIGVPGSFPSTLSAFDATTGQAIHKAEYPFQSFSVPFAVRRAPSPKPCQPTETSYCFLNGRFQVTATWQDFQGSTGDGQTVPGSTDETGLMWFFSPDNWELMVKLLDGCSINNHFWFLLSGTTNVGYTVTVTDTITGTEQVFQNLLGEESVSVIEFKAFDNCS